MSESGDKGLETLLVWQKAMNLSVKICKQILPKLPEDEKYCLAVQLRRSAQSIPANIAEGYGRYYYQDAVRFCYIARGSLEESFSHLTFASRMDYLPQGTYAQVSGEINELRRMLNGYITFLKDSKRGENEPGSHHATHEDSPPYVTENDLDPNFDLDTSVPQS